MVEDDDDALDVDDCQPRIALGAEGSHIRHALGELEVGEGLVELVEELEELDDALLHGSCTLEFLSRSASS